MVQVFLGPVFMVKLIETLPFVQGRFEFAGVKKPMAGLFTALCSTGSVPD